MAHWIGVAGSFPAVERLRNELETWWCVPKEASAGDDLLVYVARSRIKQQVSDDQGGIASLFSIAGADPERIPDCRRFGGDYSVNSPVRIALVTKFANPLKLATMKTDAILAASTGVTRSFQGTCFPLSDQEFARILKLLSKPSPS